MSDLLTRVGLADHQWLGLRLEVSLCFYKLHDGEILARYP